MEAHRRRGLAYHEAGHAVIGRALGITCGSITIEPDEDSAGHSITAGPFIIVEHWEDRGKFRTDPDRSAIIGRIITFMAGREAEFEFLGYGSRRGDRDDRYQIALMAEELVIPRRQTWKRYERRLRSKAGWLVHHRRSRVSRVAEALLMKGTLQDEAVAALLPEFAPRCAIITPQLFPYQIALARHSRLSPAA